MTEDQENVNLFVKDNALRNEGDSYPTKCVILSEAKDLKEFTKKVASIETSVGTTHFQSALLPFTTFISLYQVTGSRIASW